MAKVEFGQIPFEAICRFGELTKTEITVLSYLYACRNQETKLCNPSRKTIIKDTSVQKSHLSTALKTLTEKGWLLENSDGDFSLSIPEKVPKSGTRKVSQKVPKSVTKVPDSGTKSSEIGNSHIKELNIERTEKEQRTKNIVSDKPKPTRKRESDLTVEQKQAFNDGMKFLKGKIGAYPDGAAQGKALKWMLQNGASIVQIQKGLERQIAEFQGRYRASYLSLQKSIITWIKEGDGQILEAKNGTYSKPTTANKPTSASIIANRSYRRNLG